jgi:hypothetical protein
MELQSIQKRIVQLEKLQQEVRISREMIKGELENDTRYDEAAVEVKAATAKRKQIKDEILGSGPNQEIVRTIKENAEEISTLREILSAELAQYYSENNTDEIVDSFGATRKFHLEAKLLPAGKIYDKRDDQGRYDKE